MPLSPRQCPADIPRAVRDGGKCTWLSLPRPKAPVRLSQLGVDTFHPGLPHSLRGRPAVTDTAQVPVRRRLAAGWPGAARATARPSGGPAHCRAARRAGKEIVTVTHPGTPTLTTALDCVFVWPGEDERARVAGRNVLGSVTYGHGGRPPGLLYGVPRLEVAMAAPADRPVTEVWTTDRQVRAGRQDDLVYAEDGEHFFCAVRIDERDVYRDAVRAVYESAFTLMWRLGYTRLVRMWNLVGAITESNGEGTENYRDFCVGRAQVFEAWSDRIAGMPAATGIGSLRPGIDLYFLASRSGIATHLENPRQTPAHQYPRQYGPQIAELRPRHRPGVGGRFRSGPLRVGDREHHRRRHGPPRRRRGTVRRHPGQHRDAGQPREPAPARPGRRLPPR
ncbi:hypothetical protein GCM10020254_86070 [Streptomyces goshikiensis]